VVATPLSLSLYVLLSIQDQGGCSVLGIFSGIFSYFFSWKVTSTNDAIVSDLYVQCLKIAHIDIYISIRAELHAEPNDASQ
jgi:hypothetical protein